jgi:HEAT repeat protein
MSRWVEPTAEDLSVIKRMGPSAIPPLDRSFSGNRSFQRFLVVRLLREIGGPEIVPSLRRALNPQVPNSVRVAALAALTATPDDLAIPLIKAYANDRDPLVAQRARDLLVSHYNVAVDQ